MTSSQKLPKILFIGAVTFAETTGSHLIFYRLFKKYPATKLMVIGSHRYAEDNIPLFKLPGVSYHILQNTTILKIINFISRFDRFSRLVPIYTIWFFIYKRALHKIIEQYKPDLILTLTMYFEWQISYEMAQRFRVPLELVLHDRWEDLLPPYFARRLRSEFKRVYQFARHRFCISPTMEKLYYRETGIRGDVLFPIGNEQPPSIELNHAVSSSPHKEDKPLTVVFFGNIWYPLPVMAHLSDCLCERGMKLVIISNKDTTFFRENKIYRDSSVYCKPSLKNNELLRWCKTNADILYLPLTFDKNHELFVQYSFPSKLTDYTSLGLPLIIHAPPTASVVEFAGINTDTKFAEIVTSDQPEALKSAINALMDEQHRNMLGKNSLKIWRRFFAAEVVRAQFFEKITRDSVNTENS